MEHKFTYYRNDGRGRGQVCSYFDPCPQWYAKGSGTLSEHMKDLTENWARFCVAYQVKRVFRVPPALRIIGCRKYELASEFLSKERYMADHPIGVETKDGKYLLVGSNYHTQDTDTVPLGEYKGFKYEMKRTILPVEYSFYNTNRLAITYVWECIMTPV